MCAGGEDGKDSCQGDSGGPLMSSEKVRQEFRWFLIGVVSSGPAACGVEGRPSIYTKVPDFVDWILKNMRE
ncbi:UNVERIFIED_CONTAM: hypothetical protein PYX00_007824 [Menopon gallinae]|uniref:Peptidase S1 domain-containing protein n=1 Tax=Menopon gallinae TaxID=328185 RepID=A0AAW2HKR8_9NEOP